MTIANSLYKTVDVDSSEGVRNQVINWCANNEHLVVSVENEGLFSHAVFTDQSAISFDDYSVSVAG